MDGCEHSECSCVFSQEEVEKLVDLTKEPSYRLPSGLSREERRKWISDIGSKLLTQNSEEEKLWISDVRYNYVMFSNDSI